MNRTKIKICGIRDKDTVRAIRQLPVDYIGFMFAESKRRISPREAAELADMIPGSKPETVGVFRNQGLPELEEVLKRVPLDVVQLHGEETPEMCREIKRRYDVKLFKVFSVAGASEAGSLTGSFDAYAGLMDALMLDTFDPVLGGGTGRAFQWEIIPEVRKWTETRNIPLLVAGGLHAGNVRELVETYRPDGVDVSSGVESGGVKDPEKIKMFVERVTT